MGTDKSNILVTGAAGQIGTELTAALRDRYSPDQVIASDIKKGASGLQNAGPYEELDVRYYSALKAIIKKHRVGYVYHLAALLSATGEQQPQLAWDINMNGLLNILELAREAQLQQIFWPSSIAVFGPHTPKQQTPQHTVMDPDTVYGISKLAGERWCYYYHHKYDIDVRSVRYPGLISYNTEPGGGTTDYAVDIFYNAIEDNQYDCFLGPDTKLPMMYMPDAIKATLDLMHTPSNKLTIWSSYNINSLSFAPRTLARAIQKEQPDFTISYSPDYREDIAQSWPASIDDTVARNDWNWEPDYHLQDMTKDMLHQIKKKKKTSPR